MFYHAVLMHIAEGADAGLDDQAEALAERIRAECKGLISFHYGSNIADRGKAFNRAVTGVFESSAAHDAYQVSAPHVALSELLKPHIEDIAVADLDTDGNSGA